MADFVTTSDRYGFTIKVLPSQIKERADCDASAEKEKALWDEKDYITQGRLPGEFKLKEYVRRGLPPSVRARTWMEMSNAYKKKAAHASNYYTMMVQAAEAGSAYCDEIEQDSRHTFPDHPWLCTPEGQSALNRVLMAYSMHNDKVGYVRSMNAAVALMLVVLDRSEENAFWVLATIVEDTLFPGTFSRNLEGCQVEMKALDELISDKLPRLAAHFQVIEMDISLLATDWYLGLYATSFPAETVCRIWDALLLEGPKILFRVALAMLKVYEDNVLKVDNAAEVVLRMRKAASTMHQRDVLMGTAFEGIGSLGMATIDKYRDMKILEVEAALAERGVKGTLPEAHGPSGVGNKEVKEAAAHMKAGFSKFMTGAKQLADKTAAAAAEKLAQLKAKDNQ